jgi:transcriptional regulator with XRE-family HTH domain
MTNENSPNMGPFISELRKAHNLTQRELADQLGVTDKAVSKWERGLSYPDISLLSRLAQIFGVTTGELLNGEKSASTLPAVKRTKEVKSQLTSAEGENSRDKAQWKHAAVGFGIGLLSL